MSGSWDLQRPGCALSADLQQLPRRPFLLLLAQVPRLWSRSSVSSSAPRSQSRSLCCAAARPDAGFVARIILPHQPARCPSFRGACALSLSAAWIIVLLIDLTQRTSSGTESFRSVILNAMKICHAASASAVFAASTACCCMHGAVGFWQCPPLALSHSRPAVGAGRSSRCAMAADEASSHNSSNKSSSDDRKQTSQTRQLALAFTCNKCEGRNTYKVSTMQHSAQAQVTLRYLV